MHQLFWTFWLLCALITMGYSRETLISLKPNIYGLLPQSSYKHIKDLGINKFPATIRGSSAGVSKIKTIPVRVTSQHHSTQSDSPSCVTSSNLTSIPQPIPVHVTHRSSSPSEQSPSDKSERQPVYTKVNTIRWDIPTILNSNARSITEKVDELSIFLSLNNVQVCCITESWAKEGTPDSVYRLPGYEIFRKDRKDRVGGGVMVHIKDDIPYTRWSELENDEFESLWITISPHKLPKSCSPLTFGFLYHPEHRTAPKHHYAIAQHMRQSLDYILTKRPNSGIILTGDFNKFPDRLITSSFSGLKQCVKFPTREEATLDKFLYIRDETGPTRNWLKHTETCCNSNICTAVPE